MAFFGSNKSRRSNSNLMTNRRGRSRSMRSQNRMMVRQMGYNQQQSNPYAVQTIEYVEEPTKKQIEAQQLGFTGFSIKNGDLMIVLDPGDILPEYIQDNANIIGNGVFDGINIDKLGIVYSPKKKMFYYLALNSNYTCFILFKSNNIHELPNFANIDIDILPVNSQILENVNRLMNSVYSLVHDLTSNPIMVYKINEIFKI